jgi:perosamine synthetase
LKVIEDAAEMHGQSYRGRPCGSFGDISIFSFYPNKHITTGEGGMVVTDVEATAQRCRSLRNLCFKPQQRFVHDELGWNYRMTNLQAAVGVAQLEQIEGFIKKKRAMGKRYTELLKDIPYINLPLAKTSYADNIYWVYGIVLNEKCQYSTMDIVKKLAERKVQTRPFFYPMHLQPVFNKIGLFKDEKYPVAEALAERGFYIPSGLGLTNEQIDKVTKVVREVLL